MNEILVSPEAGAELDDIWLYAARESRSIEIADRVIDGITSRFGLLARYPAAGRGLEDLGFFMSRPGGGIFSLCICSDRQIVEEAESK